MITMRNLLTTLLLPFTLLFGTPTMADTDAQLLVLSAPRADDPYYARFREQILTFQIHYAKQILQNDTLMILTDEEGYDRLTEEIPERYLLLHPMEDIWARDYTTVTPRHPVQFRYAPAAQAGDADAARVVQDRFREMARENGLRFRTTDLILDGGNLVSNGHDRVIVSDRFLEDNDLTHAQGLRKLRQVLRMTHVAIIPNDDPEGLAHADGMVMFTDRNTLFVNRYDEPLRSRIHAELKRAFPEITPIEIPALWADTSYDKSFSSACGIYVNAVVTDRTIYLPQYGNSLDKTVLNIVRSHTEKTVVPVPTQGVCTMGGGPRCLTWQVMGSNAQRLLQATRE
ncbi:MAG: agmatine deiminase family protein [Magnetococcales bacterium]|nr:agmatine deiminase family protein [Magnetococcales bacterium]